MARESEGRIGPGKSAELEDGRADIGTGGTSGAIATAGCATFGVSTGGAGTGAHLDGPLCTVLCATGLGGGLLEEISSPGSRRKKPRTSIKTLLRKIPARISNVANTMTLRFVLCHKVRSATT